MIFKEALLTGVFPLEWQKKNIVPSHKKNDKQYINNCGPVSLLLICGKPFERIVLNKKFSFFSINKRISKSKSSLRSRDSCISQIYSITHKTLHILVID